MVLITLVGCASDPNSGPGVHISEDRASEGVTSEDEALRVARAVARRGLPSPTPELDVLVELTVTTTPELRLKHLLETQQNPWTRTALQTGDRIDVVVLGHPELSGKQIVSSGGEIQIPMAGSFQAEGRSPGELAGSVRQVLERSVVRRADVTIRLIERARRSVRVVGQVEEPGIYDLSADRPLSLHSLLALAKGLRPDADGKRLALIRSVRGQEGVVRRCYHLGHEEVLRAHLAGREVWLQPQDQVVVPRLPTAYVYGAVRKPGPVTLRKGSSAAAVLLEAGDVTEQADPQELRLLDGEEERTRISLDTLIKPNQVLYVPSRPRVYVIGAVTQNGPLALPRSGLTILQALAAAGGFREDADIDETHILRRTPSGEQVRIRVPVSRLLKGELSHAEFTLRPGDLISVPKRIW